VDLNRFKPGRSSRQELGLPLTGKIVLMVSAMDPSKHIDEAIEAVSRLEDATLVVAGDGPIRSALQKLAAEKLGERYRQIQLPSSEMPRLYRSADAFLHLSRTESFGNVYVEALASGLPVVAIESPHTRWILGNDAYFVSPGDYEAISEKIRSALQVGEEQKRLFASRARRFGCAETASKYREFLNETVVRKRLSRASTTNERA
jgi:glycosyltransferase involved in cell wall biosynthesis